MNSYYKYVPTSKEDESWGLCVLNAGFTHVEAHKTYPVRTHPASYNFNWEKGRILQEFQLIYITNGKGTFESETVHKQIIKEGTIILLFPEERHRYKPSEETGWHEYWIGIKGEIADRLLHNNFITPEKPLIHIGFNEGVLNLFNSIIDTIREEKTGYQALAAGAALHLIGLFHATSKQYSLVSEEKEMLVDRAKLLFRSKIMEDFSQQDAADLLQVGYSRFRKLFKKYTGLAPGQYYIQLKLEKAKEMLSNPNIPIKEIAYSLNFETYNHFSKLFARNTGFTPLAYRKRAVGRVADDLNGTPDSSTAL